MIATIDVLSLVLRESDEIRKRFCKSLIQAFGLQ
jgi:hypothetical protein